MCVASEQQSPLLSYPLPESSQQHTPSSMACHITQYSVIDVKKKKRETKGRKLTLCRHALDFEEVMNGHSVVFAYSMFGRKGKGWGG